jgi:hypothetical protein
MIKNFDTFNENLDEAAVASKAMEFNKKYYGIHAEKLDAGDNIKLAKFYADAIEAEGLTLVAQKYRDEAGL